MCMNETEIVNKYNNLLAEHQLFIKKLDDKKSNNEEITITEKKHLDNIFTELVKYDTEMIKRGYYLYKK
jgi:hypothetical protein